MNVYYVPVLGESERDLLRTRRQTIPFILLPTGTCSYNCLKSHTDRCYFPSIISDHRVSTLNCSMLEPCNTRIGAVGSDRANGSV